MSDLDDTQNWKTLRAKHQVVCADCETIIYCLEQEHDALQAQVKKLKDDYKGMLELATAKIKGPLQASESINRLQVTNERYKTALEKIASKKGYSDDTFDEFRKLAQAALVLGEWK